MIKRCVRSVMVLRLMGSLLLGVEIRSLLGGGFV